MFFRFPPHSLRFHSGRLPEYSIRSEGVPVETPELQFPYFVTFILSQTMPNNWSIVSGAYG